MEKKNNNFDLDVPIMGMEPQEYMAKLLEKNENQTIEIERAKTNVAILKQMNNRSRIMLDAAKFRLKEKESIV